MMKNTVVIILLSVFSGQVYGQNKIDSLKSLLPLKKGTELADIFYELAYEYTDLDYPLAVRYGRKGLELAYLLKDTLRIVKTGSITAAALRRQNKMDSAIVIGERIIKLAEKKDYKVLMIRIINGLAWAYTASAQYDQALKHYFWNIELLKSAPDPVFEPVTYNNIGLVYYKLGDYNKAISYYLLCLDLRLKSKASLYLDVLYVNIALCYSELNNFSEAEKFVIQGLATCGETCGDEILVEAHFALGTVRYEQHRIKEAEKHFLTSYNLAIKNNNNRFVFDNVYYLSRIQMDQKRFADASYYLHTAEKQMEQGITLPKEEAELYLRLSELHGKTGKCEKASLYQNKYIALRDTIYSRKLTTNLMKTEAEYLEKENKAKITSQKEILALKEEVIDRQQLLNIFIVGMAVMLMFLAAILFRSNHRKQRINRILNRKVKERTVQLEKSHRALLRETQERDILIKHTTANITSSLATINGLCLLGIQDKDDPKQYITKVKITSDHLALVLKNLQTGYRGFLFSGR